MSVCNKFNKSFIGALNVDCKSTAKSAETSALPAVQHYPNVIMIGSSSAVTMISISHLFNKFIIIQQMILSLGICCGQLKLFILDYLANLIYYIYTETGSFYLYRLFHTEIGSINNFQKISEYGYKCDIVKQDILQLLSLIQYTDTTVGYWICLYSGTSTIIISSRAAQYHVYYVFTE